MNAALNDAERKAKVTRKHITIFSAPKRGIYEKRVEDCDTCHN
jgi:hypothetical protein